MPLRFDEQLEQATLSLALQLKRELISGSTSCVIKGFSIHENNHKVMHYHFHAVPTLLERCLVNHDSLIVHSYLRMLEEVQLLFSLQKGFA